MPSETPRTQKITDAQLRALDEVAANHVRWSRLSLRYWSTEFPPTVRSDVVARLVDRGLAKVGARCVGLETSHYVYLTAAGRQARR